MPTIRKPMWSVVSRFARVMKSRLHANRAKGGWQGMDADQLLSRLKKEVFELESEIGRARNEYGYNKNYWTASKCRAVRNEAADVANFALMIADNFGDLKEVEEWWP